MTKIREILESKNNRGADLNDDVLGEIWGFFEDIRLMLDQLSGMDVIPYNTQKKLIKVNKDVLKIETDLQKELGN